MIEERRGLENQKNQKNKKNQEEGE